MNTDITKEQAEELAGMVSDLVTKQEPLGDEFQKVFDENRWQLYGSDAPPSAPIQHGVREAFESWVNATYGIYCIRRDENGEYEDIATCTQWDAWQAALFASPAGDKVEGEREAREDHQCSYKDGDGICEECNDLAKQQPESNEAELVEALRYIAEDANVGEGGDSLHMRDCAKYALAQYEAKKAG